MIDPAARARLEWWKQSLLDLSVDNPLIDAREGRTCIVLPAVDPLKLAATLDAGGGLSIASGRDVSDGSQLWAALEPDVLERRLVAIRREARRQRVDRGAHVLWMALGALAWKLPEDDQLHHAPLALWPVELDLAGGSVRVVSAVESGWLEPRLNATLAEKLRLDFDLVFASTLDTFAPDRIAALTTLLEAADGIAVTRPGWHVERGARLGCFAPARHAQWEELERRGDEIVTNPVVAQLAAGSGLAFAQPSGIAATAVTQRLGFQSGASELASELLAPLDADAAQLQAVAAAGVGASFVLQAPPGTGASQTITNLIVHCIGRGKSVLFVSDKVSALADVQQRLAAIGLGDLCLSFASRKDVVEQLERVLTRAFRPASGPALLDGNRLAELRTALDGHASSMHRVGAFGRSIHDALGRLVELRTTPRAALADSDAVGLNGATFEQRRSAVEQLAAAAVRVEPVSSHPWRVSTLDRTTFGKYPEGRERALTAIDEAAAAAAALKAATRDVASLVPNLVARTRDQLQALGALAAIAASSPRPGAELLTPLTTSRGASARSTDTTSLDEQIALIRARGGANTTLEAPRDPLAFLLLAKRHRALAKEVDDRFTDAVDLVDAAALWSQLRKWTNSMAPLRFVALRTARAEIKAVAQPLQLETDGAMISALEAVIAERACRAALEAAAEPARRWFGELFGDHPLELDLDTIESAVLWGSQLRRAFDAVDVINGDTGRDTAWRSLVAQVAAGPGGLESPPDDNSISVLGRMALAVARWIPALSELAAATGIDLRDDAEDHLAMLAERTATLRHAIDDLADWVTFHNARHAALACGVGPAVAAIDRGDLAATDLALAWERATILAWVDAELAESQVAVMGSAHHAHVAAFADLDRAALALVRSRALVRFAERMPAVPLGKLDPDSEVGVAISELRKPSTRPLRELFAKIPTLLPRIAPCLALTPGGLAQHLDPAMKFDVVVLDEASQMPTAEAIGALSRGSGAVIVGDSQLLRPTRATADGSTLAVDGVLADCLAARIPELRLSWHYRSRHHDLVAYANERFYDDRLHVFPTTTSATASDVGIARRAGTDADTIVADVLSRLRDPAQRGRSLAVLTSSRALAERIEDLLDAARSSDPSIDTAWSSEPSPIVACVDDAQGIVRDVVLLAADAPLDGRLAVAITRACEQLVVFAPDDLSADPELAAMLARSERILVEEPPASPITAAIARALVDRGWSLRHQIGCGAYKIDLAVVDPSDPERFVLAIELDGNAYASAPAARDRDRLRGETLAQLGWRVHRVWSMDWWTDPEREIQRAHGAIVTAIAGARQRRTPAAAPRPTPAVPRAARPSERLRATSVPPLRASDRTIPTSFPVETFDSATLPTLAAGSAPVRLPKNAIPIGPYIAAAIPPGRRTPDDLFAPRHLAELGKVVEQVLAAEAPMHVDLLARRVGAYFGIGRVTQRVTEQVRTVLLGRGRLGEERDIVWRLDQDPAAIPPVRVAGASPGSPTGRRDIAEIPLSELASAARIVVERAAGIGTTDLVRDAARLIGFARITPEISDRVAQAVRLAQVRQLISIDNGRARLPD